MNRISQCATTGLFIVAIFSSQKAEAETSNPNAPFSAHFSAAIENFETVYKHALLTCSEASPDRKCTLDLYELQSVQSAGAPAETFVWMVLGTAITVPATCRQTVEWAFGGTMSLTRIESDLEEAREQFNQALDPYCDNPTKENLDAAIKAGAEFISGACRVSPTTRREIILKSTADGHFEWRGPIGDDACGKQDVVGLLIGPDGGGTTLGLATRSTKEGSDSDGQRCEPWMSNVVLNRFDAWIHECTWHFIGSSPRKPN